MELCCIVVTGCNTDICLIDIIDSCNFGHPSVDKFRANHGSGSQYCDEQISLMKFVYAIYLVVYCI